MIILDENLSYRLKPHLVPIFGEVLHVSDLSMAGVEDRHIWEVARDRRAVILSKDADFYHYGLMQNPPPKVIWIDLGNASTAVIGQLLVAQQAEISDFIANTYETVFILGEDQ